MIGILVCIGICYLGLLACGIVFLVDTIQHYKRKKEISKRWKNEEMSKLR